MRGGVTVKNMTRGAQPILQTGLAQFPWRSVGVHVEDGLDACKYAPLEIDAISLTTAQAKFSVGEALKIFIYEGTRFAVAISLDKIGICMHCERQMADKKIYKNIF